MGEQAGYFLDDVCDYESLCDDYALGFMSLEEAYYHGIVDELGFEQRGVQGAYDRYRLTGLKGLNEQIETEILKFDSYHNARDNNSTHEQNKYVILSDKAIENLFKEHPTCNICSKEMQKRNGKFGAFYFCSCPEQKTVSEKYWLSVRIGSF